MLWNSLGTRRVYGTEAVVVALVILLFTVFVFFVMAETQKTSAWRT